MDEPRTLAENRHWRMAVWALRVGFLALVLVVAGVIVLATGSAPWVLAAGVLGWLACAAITVTGVVWARRDLPEPRPGLWPMRFMLLRATVHTRSSVRTA